ncbi:Mitochondrial import inner membrane translocase subunit TIM50-C [Trichinella spiralis]|uniref:Small C-terminal domain Phosphatase protein 4 n=1 Tax=Trichinella spiralis TaxID=6334 RepID=A0A0V1AYK8_TRISP|nr:Mitochondrial import inner membrane translocase subunit TIM50-C [Trichinella spiralis]
MSNSWMNSNGSTTTVQQLMMENMSTVYDDSEARVLSALRQVNFWYLFVVITVGIFGNMLAVMTIVRSRLMKISSNHYLIALTCSDSVFLLSLFLIWLSKLNVAVYHRDGFCQLVLFCLNCSSWLSSWYTMILTVERRAAACSIGRTRRIICLALPFPVLFNIWIIIATGVNETGACNMIESYYYAVYSRANAFADLKGGSKSTTSSRGSAAGSALELPLMRRHGGCGGGGCGGGSSSSGHAGRPAGSQERKITQSLVTLSCVFVALNVPSYSLRLRDYVLVATGRIPQNQPLSEIILENIRIQRNCVTELIEVEIKNPKMISRLVAHSKLCPNLSVISARSIFGNFSGTGGGVLHFMSGSSVKNQLGFRLVSHSAWPLFTASKVDFQKEDLVMKEELKRYDETMRKNTKYGLAILGIGCLIAGGVAVAKWGGPVKDDLGFPVVDEFSEMPFLKQRILRTWKQIRLLEKYIKEPSRDILLPDPLKEPYYQPPFTLVIELTGVLVHPDWTYQTGWRFKKRPAVEHFIKQVGFPNFEVVIFTSEPGISAFPIIDSLDPQGLIMYRLFRDATKYVNGHHVKDLSRLNRDLSRVILIDWDPKSFQLQPENVLRLPKWEGSDSDLGLVELASFLKTLAASGIKDVRPVLQYYSSFDNPLEEYRKKRQQLEEEQEKLNDSSKPFTGPKASSFMGRFWQRKSI